MGILILAEHNNSNLNSVTASVVNASQQIDANDIDILVAGYNASEAAQEASYIEGVKKVLLADAEPYAYQLAENVALLLADLGKDYDYILAPATTNGKNILPRVAALLDVAQVSDIVAVEGANKFTRPVYAGSMLTTVETSDAIQVISVRPSAFDNAPSGTVQATVESIEKVHDSGLSAFVSESLSSSERPELSAADIVVSGGRGMQSGDNFKLIEAVADKLGAAIGASRAAVDAGFVPNDLQVGQTGKIVAPKLYIAVGISGAIQHLAGMKDSQVIVAINKDEEAPIFQVADYGLVADLFTALPELAEALS